MADDLSPSLAAKPRKPNEILNFGALSAWFQSLASEALTATKLTTATISGVRESLHIIDFKWSGREDSNLRPLVPNQARHLDNSIESLDGINEGVAFESIARL